jgi:hypothetical protein
MMLLSASNTLASSVIADSSSGSTIKAGGTKKPRGGFGVRIGAPCYVNHSNQNK